MAELKPSNFQPPVFRSQGDMRGNHQKHRYRQEPPMQHHRQQPQRNVLQMENPEVVRQRRQHNEKAVVSWLVGIFPLLIISSYRTCPH